MSLGRPSAAAISGEIGTDFGGPVEDAAAGRDQRPVVVGPRRAGQLEQPPALGEGASPRPGFGSTKTWRWSNAATRRMCSESSIPLPNTSPDMSPTPTTVKSWRLGVDAHLAEVPLDRLPRPAGGDAHRLVVVAGRATGGEGVVEPEAVLLRHGVGDVGERRRALVGRDDEVGVVAVVAHDVRRRDRLALDPVVGEVEQPGDEQLVGGDALGQPGLAVRRRGRAAAWRRTRPCSRSGR